MRKHIFPLLILMVLLTRNAWAGPAQLSPSEAITQALRTSHLLQAAEYEKSAVAESVAASRSRYRPRLTLEESAGLTNSPTRAFMMKLDQGRFSLAGDLNHPPTTSDFRTTLTFEQPLFDPQLASGVALAEKALEAEGLSLQRRREEVALAVLNNYLDLQQARLKLQIAEQGVRDAREHERLTMARSSAGLGLKSDELRVRTFVSEMEQQLISAGNTVQMAMLRLAQATGKSQGELVDIREPYTAPVINRSRVELEQLAQQQRSELKELSKGVERAELGVAMARRSYLPTINGSASYQMSDRDLPFGRDNDAWLVGATLRWELYDGSERGHVTEKAGAMHKAAAEYLWAERQEVGLQVAESYLRREEAGKRLEVVRHAEQDASEGLRILTKRYENSLALLVEVLDAQTVLNRSRAQIVEMEAEYARATIRLLFASGILLQEIMP